MKKQIIGLFLVFGVLMSTNSFSDSKAEKNEILINYLLEQNKELSVRLKHLENKIKISGDDVVINSLKSNKIIILDNDQDKRIELSVGNKNTQDIFTEPAIILFDKLNKVRAVYGLEKDGFGHLAFRSKTGVNEIIMTNSPKWGITQPNFLRSSNHDGVVEAVFHKRVLFSYKAIARGTDISNVVSEKTKKHSFCAINNFSFNYSGTTGSTKICSVEQKPDGTWKVNATADRKQVLECDALCF